MFTTLKNVQESLTFFAHFRQVDNADLEIKLADATSAIARHMADLDEMQARL